MLHEQVFEILLYVIKVILVPKAYVIYLISKIKGEIVSLQYAHYITIGMIRNMEISRYPINFKETFEVAALLLLELFLHSVLNGCSEFVFLKSGLSAEHLVFLVDPNLVELPHDICLVSAHDVLNV
jgi:hypothetical protein